MSCPKNTSFKSKYIKRTNATKISDIIDQPHLKIKSKKKETKSKLILTSNNKDLKASSLNNLIPNPNQNPKNMTSMHQNNHNLPNPSIKNFTMTNFNMNNNNLINANTNNNNLSNNISNCTSNNIINNSIRNINSQNIKLNKVTQNKISHNKTNIFPNKISLYKERNTFEEVPFNMLKNSGNTNTNINILNMNNINNNANSNSNFMYTSNNENISSSQFLNYKNNNPLSKKYTLYSNLTNINKTQKNNSNFTININSHNKSSNQNMNSVSNLNSVNNNNHNTIMSHLNLNLITKINNSNKTVEYCENNNNNELEKKIQKLKEENEDLIKKNKHQKKLIDKLMKENQKLESDLTEANNNSNKLIGQIEQLNDNQSQLILLLRIVEKKGINLEKIIDKWNEQVENGELSESKNGNDDENIQISSNKLKNMSLDNINYLNNNSESISMWNNNIENNNTESFIDSSSIFLPITLEANNDKKEKIEFKGIPKLNLSSLNPDLYYSNANKKCNNKYIKGGNKKNCEKNNKHEKEFCKNIEHLSIDNKNCGDDKDKGNFNSSNGMNKGDK